MTGPGVPNRKSTYQIESYAATREWPPWLEQSYLIGLVTVGVAIDWYCAFEWFSRRYSFWSGSVIRRMVLIVLSCAAVGFLATLPRRDRWQVGVAVFASASATVSGNLLLWWVGHR